MYKINLGIINSFKKFWYGPAFIIKFRVVINTCSPITNKTKHIYCFIYLSLKCGVERGVNVLVNLNRVKAFFLNGLFYQSSLGLLVNFF